MVDLKKYSVKELANTGVDFYFIDEFGLFGDPGEKVPDLKLVVYGMDSKQVNAARREFNAVTNTKGVKAWKEEEAMLKFITACVKSWDNFKFGETEVKNGDREALMEFFDECPMFRDQLTEFITEREHFLSK